MKISNSFILMFALSSSIKALACLPIPLEMRTDFYNDAAAQLLTNQDIRIDSVTRVVFGDPRVLRYEWIEANAGLECHDKEVLEVQVTLNYRKSGDYNLCQLEGVVVKTEGFYSNAPRPSYEFHSIDESCRS